MAMTPAEHEFHVPKFKNTGTSTAITFHFRVVDRTRHMGWALCTINETTGELTVCSDWGNWTYLWGHSGMPQSSYSFLQREGLLEFIGDRSDGGCDYLAMKLTSDGRSNGRDDAKRFDAHKTCLKFKEMLRERRREVKRDASLWCERLMQLDNWTWITNEPWEHTVYEPTTAFYVLRDGILPALRDAAMAVVVARRPAPPSLGWAGDLAQREIAAARRGYRHYHHVLR